MAGWVEDLRGAVAHYASPGRRRKARVLGREWFNERFGPDDGTDDPWRSNVDRLVLSWAYEQRTPLDPDFFQALSKPLVDDVWGDDGTLHTTHRHEVHALAGATSYTTESTHRTVFTADGQAVPSLSYASDPARRPTVRRQRVTRRVEGTTANLYGPTACANGNYAHWFIDALPRLFLIERALDGQRIDHVLVPPLRYDFQWDSLHSFGIDAERVVEMPALECIAFERLLASTPIRGNRSSIFPGWAIDRYRGTLLPGAATVPSVAGKRVYITRRDAPSRKFINEEAVCRALEARGFDAVELSPLSLDQKIAVFRDAAVIVGQTGAGLTNMAFCGPGTTLVELVDDRFVDHLYASTVLHVRGRHVAHQFEGQGPLGRLNAYVARSTLDVDALLATLDRHGL